MTDISKKTISGLGFLGIFMLLILFNQRKAQKEILTSSRPQYRTTLVNSPQNYLVDDSVKFTWEIDAPNTSFASTTTIYYGPIGSPSALTTQNSPEAVGYPNRLTDYLTGSFSLPDIFSASTSSLKGTVFYRSYARVGDQHLWSEEFKLVTRSR